MIKNNSILLFLLCVLLNLSTSSTESLAQTSQTEYVTFTTQVNPVVKKVIAQALNKKLDWFYKEYKYMPYLHYALVDLNGDKKNEVIVRFAEEWEFRDKFNNLDTHIFAQTSKGLIEILETQAAQIEIGRADTNGVSTIYAHQRQRKNRPNVYIWDGKSKYVKKD